MGSLHHPLQWLSAPSQLEQTKPRKQFHQSQLLINRVELSPALPKQCLAHANQKQSSKSTSPQASLHHRKTSPAPDGLELTSLLNRETKNPSSTQHVQFLPPLAAPPNSALQVV